MKCLCIFYTKKSVKNVDITSFRVYNIVTPNERGTKK
nr:MAG TPA: hypothetical protein [Caudoviricetes sp.]